MTHHKVKNLEQANSKRPLFLSLTTLILGFLTAPAAMGQTGQGSQGPAPQQQSTSPHQLPNSAPVMPPQGQNQAPIKLQVLGKEAFCTRLVKAFASVGSELGYNPTQSALIANGATTRVIQDFRSGRASDFLHSQAILADVKLTLVKTAPGSQPMPGYLNTAQFLGRALGVTENVSLALSAGELRFLPHIPKGTDVIVVARNAAALTIERINKIAELSKSMNIRINVLWVGETNEDPREIEEARILAWIVAATGGKFANLGGADWPCANIL